MYRVFNIVDIDNNVLISSKNMMDINPIDLRYFFVVAESLNISRAAERLNIGQPTLSQSIQRIEHILGVKLFDRYKTGVKLTPAGKKLLSDGRHAIEVWEKMHSASQSAENSIEGRYSIGCHSAVALYSLSKCIKPLLEKYLKLEFNLKHGLSREIAADVIDLKTDFGLVMNPVRHPELMIKYLCEDRISCWRANSSKPVIEDTLIFDPALPQSQTILKKIGKAQSIKRQVTSGSLEVIANLTSEGCGIGILPRRIANLYPNLEPVTSSPWVLDRLALIYRADRKNTASFKVISESISNINFN